MTSQREKDDGKAPGAPLPLEQSPEALGNYQLRYRPSRIALFLVGIIALAAVVMAVLNRGEIGEFAALATKARPSWLLLAVVSQCAAFFLVAIAWRMVLRDLGQHISLSALFPLSVAKLFADQALPSGGVSGAVFLLHALRRRGISWDHAFSAFVFAGLGAIAAFLIASILSFVVIAGAEGAPAIVSTGARAFYVLTIIAILGGGAIIAFRSTTLVAQLYEHPRIARGLDLAISAYERITSQSALFAKVTLVQLGQRGFDALTLWLAFFAISHSVPLGACFIAVSLASVAATVAPTPMGIGTFEGGMIAALAIFGVSMESALTATLLYRGLSLWAPLIPGFYVIQRELLGAKMGVENEMRAPD